MGASTSNDKRLHKFTLNEIATLKYAFHKQHQNEIYAPSAATNSLIADYNKLDSIVMKVNFAYMMAGGTFVYLLQAKQGHNIEALFAKPFKGKYTQGLTACLYIVLFFTAQS